MSQPRKPKAKPAEAKTTAYIILRRADVREEPDGANPVTEAAWLVIDEQVDEPDGTKAWRPRVVTATSKARAIEAVTGPDGPDIAEGSYKAVALTAWRGGITTRRTMKSDRLPLDEAL